MTSLADALLAGPPPPAARRCQLGRVLDNLTGTTDGEALTAAVDTPAEWPAAALAHVLFNAGYGVNADTIISHRGMGVPCVCEDSNERTTR